MCHIQDTLCLYLGHLSATKKRENVLVLWRIFLVVRGRLHLTLEQGGNWDSDPLEQSEIQVWLLSPSKHKN